MPTFERIQGAVYCDGLSLAELATRFGTPLYTYDAGAIAARYREIEDAFRDYPHRLHYALKRMHDTIEPAGSKEMVR